jgi:DNA-binding NtrC family response regulator
MLCSRIHEETMSDKLPALSLADLERRRIEECLADHNGNRTHTALELGITVRTLQRKLKMWAANEQIRRRKGKGRNRD